MAKSKVYANVTYANNPQPESDGDPTMKFLRGWFREKITTMTDRELDSFLRWLTMVRWEGMPVGYPDGSYKINGVKL